MKNLTNTKTRIYFTSCNSTSLFHAYYQPINQKTGEPWQASRYITKGQDAHWLHDSRAEVSVIGSGPLPSDWWKSGEWTNAAEGFSTEALALAAIEAEKARTKNK